MQSIRNIILKHLRVSNKGVVNGTQLPVLIRNMCTPPKPSDPNDIVNRVTGLVKKYDKIDANKVTGTADFQKDLCLDSLDKVELVMAFEQEFSLEIPDKKADKFSCCNDVVNYILSQVKHENTKGC